MTTDLIEVERSAAAPATRAAPATVMELIGRLATDPTLNVENLRALIEMHRELAADQARAAFAAAMNAAQAEIQPVVRTTENTQTRSWYGRLEDVDEAIRPIYLRHGFSLAFSTVEPLAPGNVRLECRVTHIVGHEERYYREAAPDTLGPKGAPVKTALHGAASTETFLRRYLTCGVFNVVFRGLDRDGNRSAQEETGELVTAVEAKMIDGALKTARVSLDSFLVRFKIESLADLPRARYAEAINSLKRHAEAKRLREENAA